MKDFSEHIELFDDYLKGELSNQEMITFDRRIIEDREFATAFEQYQTSIQIIKNTAFQKEVESFLESRSTPKSSKFPIYWISGIAACLLIILTISFWGNSLTSSELFDKYYQSYPNVLTTRELTDLTGYEAYSNGQFDQAITWFETNNSKSDTLQFYLALAHIELAQFNEAKDALLLIDKQSIFYQQKVWFLGLLYLRSNNNDKAIDLLQQINEGDFEYKKSRALLKELE